MPQIIAYKINIELQINFEIPKPFDELLDSIAVNPWTFNLENNWIID